MAEKQTVVYELGKALYINLTNRCSNRCTFCVRNTADGVTDGLNLWLEREPSAADVLAAIAGWDIGNYEQFVFCGYGEPLMQLDVLLSVCRRLKELYSLPIRINTNGQANLIHGRDITPELAGLVDAVSISLNAKNAREYQEVCQSDYGEAAFAALLDFAKASKRYVPSVTLTVVDVLPDEDIQSCREIAGQAGVNFRVRHYIQ